MFDIYFFNKVKSRRSYIDIQLIVFFGIVTIVFENNYIFTETCKNKTSEV